MKRALEARPKRGSAKRAAFGVALVCLWALSGGAGCSSEPEPGAPAVVAAAGGQGGMGGSHSSHVGGHGGRAGQGGHAGHGGGDPCSAALDVLTEAPATLSETGLYADVATKTLAPGMRLFEPKYGLWSDGAEKSRWIYLPPCKKVDSSDMNNWSLPVGTRGFKEFSVDGARIETRLIARTGPGPNDFLYATYLWNAEETAATLVSSDGLQNAKGTDHDVPSVDGCRRCHGSHADFGGRPSRTLGFSALQLSGAEKGVDLQTLANEGWLTALPEGAVEVPGDETAQRALGYLHANCGSCHNDTPDGVQQVDLNLWLDVGLKDVESTGAFLTAVGKANKVFNIEGVTTRIAPGDPDGSSVDYRMGQRGNNAQMPPVATEKVDEAGRADVRAWIEALK